MDAFWADLWVREKRFMASAGGELRHGIPFVGVSDIAGQFYCEYKVENQFALGEVATEAKDSGTLLHQELIPEAEISAGDFVKLVSKKRPSFAVLKVWGSVGGVRIVGMPDHIIWSGGKPIWLVELKTTKGDPDSLWEDQQNQARIYGLMLDLMGFDCSMLRLAVVRLRAIGISEESRGEWLLRVSRALLEGSTKELEREYKRSMKFHIMNHERRLATAAIMSKAGYWRGEREPTSSSSEARCRACEYVSVCVKSLAKD